MAIAGKSSIRLVEFLKFSCHLCIDGRFLPEGGFICLAKPCKCARVLASLFVSQVSDQTGERDVFDERVGRTR